MRLHLAGPTSGLGRLADADPGGFRTPYWAYPWGGGLALARHVLDHPETVAGRSVMDLGAGSGLVGIAAAKARARQVLAVDVDAYAAVAAPLNAEANGVEIRFLLADLLASEPPEGVEIVLAADLFYEEALARRTTAFLERCLQAGVDVLIGDPWRTHLPRERLQVLADYSTADVGRSGQAQASAVFALKASPQS
ncbi:MAG: methyltransferase [Proteobacteria bacterium]|nr:methyltransferase [Pseudomonadota bacterium]